MPRPLLLRGEDGQSRSRRLFHVGLHCSPRRSGTAAPDVAVGEVVLTTESGDNNYATLASNGKVKLAGNRFVLQCDLKVTSVANSAILLGFASDAKNPIPNDASADPADWSYAAELVAEGSGTVGSPAFGDADGDGAPELWIPNYSDGKMLVYALNASAA